MKVTITAHWALAAVLAGCTVMVVGYAVLGLLWTVGVI